VTLGVLFEVTPIFEPFRSKIEPIWFRF